MHNCMDWRAVKFDWNKARAFLVTKEEGQLSAAAHELGMAEDRRARQVQELAQHDGMVWFERVRRALTSDPHCGER